jgi:hypothetical protein
MEYRVKGALTPAQAINMARVPHYLLNKLYYVPSLKRLELDNLEIIRVCRNTDAVILDTVSDPPISTLRPRPLVLTQLIFNARMRACIFVYEIPHPPYDVPLVGRDSIVGVHAVPTMNVFDWIVAERFHDIGVGVHPHVVCEVAYSGMMENLFSIKATHMMIS